jgi:hypothetical protein
MRRWIFERESRGPEKEKRATARPRVLMVLVGAAGLAHRAAIFRVGHVLHPGHVLAV